MKNNLFISQITFFLCSLLIAICSLSCDTLEEDLDVIRDKMIKENPVIEKVEAIVMVKIPAGTFTMGSPATELNRNDDEGPQRQVELNEFSIGKYQVTQNQYKAVMEENPGYFSSSPATGEVQGNRPVELVSWYDALVFCNKLSILEKLSPSYSSSGSTDPAEWGGVPTSSNSIWDAVVVISGSKGYRLPTEAQWEYACRAGTTTAYNTGAGISDSTGWHSSNSGGKTHEVGKKPANAWGLYDMHGNVWEWCWDWYGSDYYEGRPSPDKEPVGASGGTYRVLRGGSWGFVAEFARSAYRSYDFYPYGRYSSVGFRLVCP
jgi:formylglycine-generating enzyme required for sulfatase activity